MLNSIELKYPIPLSGMMPRKRSGERNARADKRIQLPRPSRLDSISPTIARISDTGAWNECLPVSAGYANDLTVWMAPSSAWLDASLMAASRKRRAQSAASSRFSINLIADITLSNFDSPRAWVSE
jgi:hypothetical protein